MSSSEYIFDPETLYPVDTAEQIFYLIFYNLLIRGTKMGELKQTSPKFHRILRKPIAGKA